MAQRNPRMIGGIYRVALVMTTGGMLTTYTAYNHNTSEMVGLYVIQIPDTVAVETVQPYLQPLGRRQLIQSPHVIRVYDFGIDGTRIYIATDPPRGVTLRHVLDTENVDLLRAFDLTRQLSLGVKALHEQGVVGLDLRPPFITVDTAEIADRVQIDDIGLRSLLKTLGYVGSQQVNDIGYLDPRYAPPEYINGGSIGPWSDVYQLGLLTFELVTGRLPFVGRTAAETGVMQITRPVPQMSLYKHDAPASLQAVLERALVKNLNDRFANAGQFLSALEAVQLQPVSTPGFTREMAPVKKEEDDATRVKPSQDAAQENAEEALAPEEGVYAYLCYEKDGQEIQRFAIREKKVLVGRTDRKQKIFPQVDLTVYDPDMTVSRRHALIRYKNSFFYLEDLRSYNGTMLGKLKLNPVQEEMLQHDDVVQFGSVRMIFKIPGKPSRPSLKMDKDE